MLWIDRVRWMVCGVVLALACQAMPAASQQPGVPAGSPGTSTAPGQSPNRVAPPAGNQRLPDSVFFTLDRNRDNAIDKSELATPEAAGYRSQLAEADRDGNGFITKEEFSQLGQLPFYRDVKTAAAILLVLCFAAFCLFLDGLLDPDHRDYFIYSIAAMAAFGVLSFLVGRSWFLTERPYLAFVALAPAVLIGLAFVFGATREKEEAPEGPKGPVVYKVGKGTSGTQPAKPASGPGTKKSGPPARTPRPAPIPRPPVPERRPQTPPRSAPPRPPGTPPIGPQRPPGSSPPGSKPPPSR